MRPAWSWLAPVRGAAITRRRTRYCCAPPSSPALASTCGLALLVLCALSRRPWRLVAWGCSSQPIVLATLAWQACPAKRHPGGFWRCKDRARSTDFAPGGCVVAAAAVENRPWRCSAIRQTSAAWWPGGVSDPCSILAQRAPLQACAGRGGVPGRRRLLTAWDRSRPLLPGASATAAIAWNAPCAVPPARGVGLGGLGRNLPLSLQSFANFNYWSSGPASGCCWRDAVRLEAPAWRACGHHAGSFAETRVQAGATAAGRSGRELLLGPC